MGRFSKLIKNPVRFYGDAIQKWQGKVPAKPSKSSLNSDVKESSLTAGNAPAQVAEKAPQSVPKVIAQTPVRAKKDSNPPVAKPVVPDWYLAFPSNTLKAGLSSDRPIYLYIPWIAEHGDALISKITEGAPFELLPLDFVQDLHAPGRRRDVLHFAREHPDVYRRMIARRLAPLAGRVSGVIFTFDWAPVMRIIASVCEDLGIARVLIPHESVFVDREKYYWDKMAGASVPVADLILGWGKLQKSIFVERGYPAERFKVVGAPKFDVYHAYKPLLTRDRFYRLFGLSPHKKCILFASQPLDSQLDMKVARDSQRRAITDLLNYCVANEAQIIVRLPPSRDDILGEALRNKLFQSGVGAVDEAWCYMASPEEALYHADIVTSVNSTMLFEGLLMGRPALSMKYVEFQQMWEAAGIPAVRSAEQLAEIIGPMFKGEWTPSPEGMQWAAGELSVGVFDGKAVERIRTELMNFVDEQANPRLPPLDRVFTSQPIDVIASPSSAAVLETTQRYLQSMLKARTTVASGTADIPLRQLGSVDIFVQWGAGTGGHHEIQAEYARRLGKRTLIVEDGFLRSKDIGLAGEPGLSLILDDTAPYYDAGSPTRLSKMIQSDINLTAEQLLRSESAIESIQQKRLSKYNSAPDVPLTIGEPGRKKLLLVDQRFGDKSVTMGMADQATFQQMVVDVLRERADCDVIIKQHPDAIKGGKSSFFTDERLAFAGYVPNLHRINFDVNPHALFDIVDEVYVVTSGMGFEALMAGKKVHCYGMPFYAGWGVTQDKQVLPQRTRQRSIAEIFHFAYIESSRYYAPHLGRAAEIEDVIDYLSGTT